MVPLHRRLFGHGRPTGACTERASLTRPTGHFKDNRGVRPISGSDRVGEALSTRYLQREASTWILTADRCDRVSVRLHMVEVSIRRLTVEDAGLVHAAILESIDHLRPWMPWAASEPITLEERIAWISGVTESQGIFVGNAFVGGVGLHDRISPNGREIGYWVRAGWTGRGIATSAVSLIIEQAFARPEVDHVEIHHDKANIASSRVPAKLGFTLVREVPDRIAAPGECGISCEWLLRRYQRRHT